MPFGSLSPNRNHEFENKCKSLKKNVYFHKISTNLNVKIFSKNQYLKENDSLPPIIEMEFLQLFSSTFCLLNTTTKTTNYNKRITEERKQSLLAEQGRPSSNDPIDEII